MDKLELRQKLVSGSYKEEYNEEIEKEFEQRFKDQFATSVVEYMVKKEKEYETVPLNEKKKIFSDILTDIGASEITITEADEYLIFKFKAKAKKLNDHSTIVLKIRNGKQT